MLGTSESRHIAREAAGFWWLWLVTGVVWVVAALVVLQFDEASITTIGVIVGCMLAFAAVQQFATAAAVTRLRWIPISFGVLLLAASIVCFFNPEKTFAGLADILGFIFLMVGVWWIIGALAQRGEDPLWSLGVVSGVLMVVLAFWTSGQFFIEKAYTLLVLAGIWALLHGVFDMLRAFQVRSLRDAA